MTYKEIQDLIKMVVKLEVAELKMRDGDFEISVRTKEFARVKGVKPPPVAPVMSVTPTPSAPAEPAAPPSAPATAEPTADNGASAPGLLPVKSPIVGTFYRSPSPDKPPFVNVGDMIKAGDVVCIVEAMKLFNEIESEVSGRIVRVMVEDAAPVEYDQALFMVDPKG
jgi:acetyl-CoA carboxylase biotin carboxyl carrier protein